MGDGTLAAAANASLAESYCPYPFVGVELDKDEAVDEV